MNRISDPNALAIVSRLRQKGYEAFYVGGCVRDMLLNKPISDIDITTSAHPHQIQKLFAVTLDVGAQFGVMIVVLEGVNYEVATFRNDGAYIDGRRPVSVTFSTAKEDVLRRDFTINGILYDPIEDKIIDYVNGQTDLSAKLLRAIGDPSHRFAEDKLRMIRAVRFTIRFNFTLETETKKAIQKMAKDITQVSIERITDETEKIFTGVSPDLALLLLEETGLLPILLPHFKNYESNAFKNIQTIFKHLEGCEFDTALAILLAHETNISPIKEFEFPLDENPKSHEKRLKGTKLFNLPNQTIKNISQIWACLTHFKNYSQMRQALKMRVLLNPLFPKALALLNQWEATHGASQPLTSKLKTDYASLKHQQIPESFLDGTELMDLGCQPGHNISLLKTELENLQLEDKIKSKEEAVVYIKTKHIKN